MRTRPGTVTSQWKKPGWCSRCLMHTGKPTGVAVSHCMTWFQTQLMCTMCQIRYHSHRWIIVAPDSSEP